MERFRTSRILEEKHSTQIILFLHACGPQSKSNIYKTISTSCRMPQKLEMLADEGIVEEKRAVSGNSKTVYALTSLGRTYANALEDLETQSGGDFSPLRREMFKSISDERSDDQREW